MEIEKLLLKSTNLDKQAAFYGGTLGFECNRISKTQLAVYTGINTLIFEQADQQFFYHFAFLIPTGSLEAAIDFVRKKGIELLPYEGKNIIQFKNGRAIYFYDMDGNVAEFIERPLLDFPPSDTFSIAQVIKLNEIGLPSPNPKQLAEFLVSNYGIKTLVAPEFNDRFCWVGDHNGVLIVVVEGRNWLPTQLPNQINDFSITYTDQGTTYSLKFEQNTITRVTSVQG